jgi:hypothetical protein
MHCVQAGLTYFALVFGTGFALGAIRVPFLVPRLGERTAELLEMPLMFIAIVFAARYVVRKFSIAPLTWPRLHVGLLALALLVAAELSLVFALQQRSLAQYVAGRDPISGSVYLLMLWVFALMPLILAKLRGMPPN